MNNSFILIFLFFIILILIICNIIAIKQQNNYLGGMMAITNLLPPRGTLGPISLSRIKANPAKLDPNLTESDSDSESVDLSTLSNKLTTKVQTKINKLLVDPKLNTKKEHVIKLKHKIHDVQTLINKILDKLNLSILNSNSESTSDSDSDSDSMNLSEKSKRLTIKMKKKIDKLLSIYKTEQNNPELKNKMQDVKELINKIINKL